MKATKSINPPSAKKIPEKLLTHNHIRVDNYFWLNQRGNPEVIDYLKAENDYLEQNLSHTKQLQKTLFDEIIGRIKPTDESVPYLSNGYYYYSRFEKDKEYPVYFRKKNNLKAREETILDVNKIAKGHNYCNVVGLNVSENNNFLAFGLDTLSRRIYTICIKNLSTGRFIKTRIKNTSGHCVWANDNKSFFYTVKDKTLRSYKIMRHHLGSLKNEVEVFHEKDTTFSCYITKSKSRKYIFAYSDSTLSTEVRFINANYPESDFQVIQARENNHEYHVSHHTDYFYILTNHKARNFKLVKTPVKDYSKQNWQTIIPHKKDTLIENFTVFKDYLVLAERKKGLTQLHVTNIKDNESHYIKFKEKAYSTYITVNREFNSKILRFGYSSMTTPYTTYDYNLNNRKQVLIKRQEVIGSFKPEKYITKRITAKAKDGTLIPISIVHKKGLSQATKKPLLLYGYGSYGINSEPDFSSVRLSLLDRGFIYAIAHIRGGQEMGRHWYEDGKLLKKKNTFSDFIACAEELIKLNYTDSGKLFAMGGSAGGLLMGAVLNMRPELWKGIVAAVPFVDVVTTMLDESIPLTTGEFDEWGNPKDKKYYNYILSYSPYENVSAKEHPALLVTSGFHDSQVQYWEPAKWVAKMREIKKGPNPLYLFTEMETGHSGASGRFEQYKLIALKYAFILDLLDIDK